MSGSGLGGPDRSIERTLTMVQNRHKRCRTEGLTERAAALALRLYRQVFRLSSIWRHKTRVFGAIKCAFQTQSWVYER
jgi:hypothetical protein